ncbi:MAG TPA: hypothetical protein VHE13_09340 [Opitutus sp.]|nr:hypothetical protein [Opitutus sp.]
MRYIDEHRFRRIVRHARVTNPFYRRCITDENAVPILTRRMLQAHNDEILNGHPVTISTSGSSGTPVRIHQSPERQRLSNNHAALLVRHLGGPLARTQLINPRGPNDPETLINVHTPVEQQLEALTSGFAVRRATGIVTYPSNALLLAQAITERNLDYGFIRRIGLISESFDAAQRAQIQRAFPRAKIWSSYSCCELGMISFECPFEPEFHHAATNLLGIEILDEAGRDCAPGEVGRLVITDYFNRDMPLIRYELGDLAAFGTCPCGRIDRPALQTILGKVRGCLRRRDGRRIPFIGLSLVLRDVPGLRQFQVIQDGLEAFTIKVDATRDVGPEIRAAFAQEFGYEPRITLEPVTSIPRDPSGKFHFSICRV